MVFNPSRWASAIDVPDPQKGSKTAVPLGTPRIEMISRGISGINFAGYG